MIVPRGAPFTVTGPTGAGRSWSARYGFVGVGALGDVLPIHLVL